MGFSKSLIMADSAEKKSIDEIKKKGVNRIKPCVKGQGSVL
jgi:phage terminase large subunit